MYNKPSVYRPHLTNRLVYLLCSVYWSLWSFLMSKYAINLILCMVRVLMLAWSWTFVVYSSCEYTLERRQNRWGCVSCSGNGETRNSRFCCSVLWSCSLSLQCWKVPGIIEAGNSLMLDLPFLYFNIMRCANYSNTSSHFSKIVSIPALFFFFFGKEYLLCFATTYSFSFI